MPHLDAPLAAVRLAWSLDPAQPRTLTTEERQTLQAFMGWGAFASAFAPLPEGAAARIAEQLEEILPAEALFAASQQVDTSFFTPTVVTDAVYGILRSVGFTAGRAFEPGCGAGAFMNSAPADMDISWTGVDIDPTSTRIARLLNPAAQVLTGRLEKSEVRDGTFDIAVGNVPFSSTRIHDVKGRSGALHNYFLQRAAAAVRPGGYVVMVTSRHTLDASTGILHAGTAAEFEGMRFHGAVRLPSGAFEEAGTSVVTDIIVMQKTGDSTFWDGPAERRTEGYGYSSKVTDNGLFVDTPAQSAPGVRTRVSVYWREHPEHVAGQMQVTTFERSPLVVRSTTADTDIRTAVTALAQTLPPLPAADTAPSLADVTLTDADGRKEGSFHAIDGLMHKVERGTLVPVRATKELAHLVRLRDLMADLLALEANTALLDADMDCARTEARTVYEQYVTAFGPLNRGSLVEGKVDEETGLPSLSWRRPAMGGFRRDPDSALVMALEVFDQVTGEARAADILLRRVNRAPRPIQTVDTAEQALAVSMGESGTVNLDRIAGLLSLHSPDAAREALGALVYDDPASGKLVTAGEYLSGDVREKLRLATSRGLTSHMDALQAVLPAELGPLDITLNLGHPLIRPADIAVFIRDGLGAGSVTVRREVHLGVWEVDGGDYISVEARTQWATGEITPARLVEHALNNKAPEITDRVWDAATYQWRQVRNAEQTAAAMMKLEEINDRFTTWVWEDQSRAERLCREYNDLFNSHVTRTFNGTGLAFPGMNENFTPWTHQRAAVERIVSTPTALIGHPVGAGKSATAALAAVTLRQFGLANKPLIVVPNHLLEQMSREVQQVVPTAKLLVATKEDLQRSNRRVFAARCATGDWDAVIMTHSAFTLIPVHPETEARWVQEQMFELNKALTLQDDGRSRSAKAIARRLRSFQQQMDKARHGIADEDAIYFDQLGVDYLMVDEIHLFRRLPTGSTQRGSGLGSGSSKRSTDLLLKIEALRERKGATAPVIAGFTGTPWSNTLAETWVWQRYLQPEVLDRMCMRSFDAWAGAFVKYETATEVAPDGSGFRSYRRPVGLVNVAEVKSMLAQVADLISADDLQTVRPEVEYETIVVTGTPGQMSYVAALAARADDLRSKRDTGIENDNMLLIIGDGRKVALDPRLLGMDEDSAKFTAFAQRAAASYRQNKDRIFGEHTRPGGFQLVFCDLGTPHPDDSRSYGRVRRALVDAGVPARMVRFVHEASTDKARAALFAACRDGEVAVLIGSTPKMGMGTNVQTRLTDLWHLDAPWLPSEMVQRDGRGDRHGNLSGTVRVRRVVTEGTFDAYTWQTLERKSRSFDALYSAGSSARELEDVSGATLSYGEVKALAAGNPLLLEQANARADAKKLRLLRAVHLQGVNAARQEAAQLSTQAARMRREAAALLDVQEAIDTAGMPRIDQDTLIRHVATWQRGANSYHQSRIRVGAFDVRVQMHTDDGAMLLTGFTLQHDYTTVTTFPLQRSFARKSARTIGTWLAGQVQNTLAGAEAHAQLLIERADQYDQKAAHSATFADAAVFEREEELSAALARVAEIDAAINEQAVADQAAATEPALV